MKQLESEMQLKGERKRVHHCVMRESMLRGRREKRKKGRQRKKRRRKRAIHQGAQWNSLCDFRDPEGSFQTNPLIFRD